MPFQQRLPWAATTARFGRLAIRRLAIRVPSLIVVAGVGLLAFDRPVQADDLSDLFGGGGGIFGAHQPQPQQPVAEPPPRRSRGGVSFDTRRRPNRPPVEVGGRTRKVAHAPVAGGRAPREAEVGGKSRVAHTTPSEDKVVASGHHSICVRLCDGYAFPVGDYRGEGDQAAHQATCHAECPGAATALYLMPGDTIEDSVRVGSNEKYSKLPAALKYRTGISPACTCHPAGGSRIASLLHDFTLRRGDAAMTGSGLRVFHGDSRFPFKQQDFISLRNSRDVSKADRAIFEAIERSRSTSPAKRFLATQEPAEASRPLTVLLDRKIRN